MTERDFASATGRRTSSRLRAWLPDALADLLRSRLGSVRFAGDYASWSAALAECQGYAADAILERVEHAALAVQQGKAVFERDAVLFDKVQQSWPVLASLLWIASLRKQRLHVLDVGGGLGSSYQQNRKFLSQLEQLQWSIVEQPHFVAAGRRRFEDDVLHFFPDVAAVLRRGRPDVVLLSSVLPYLEEPYTVLADLMAKELDYILIDRTLLIEGPRDRLCVQRASRRLGTASYPAWFFSRTKFLDTFDGRYRTVAEFDSLDRVHVRSRSQGFLLQRVTHGG